MVQFSHCGVLGRKKDDEFLDETIRNKVFYDDLS